ncbi:MAG: Phenylalanyl-tRNA synthetase alpha chain (EC [uncultured Aureispira sp.]|uniref:Phenylalanine--tRNA ligase alpha subunit n=1 Tax=uncultured Aureispira sp. TaxID=1331704 RepID=A0A6S6RTW6_9BACT|nr:MAG: Phenylalanyl-tRNA synthetase alpha chain (EC [uncultured Aureispira sp.]
MAIEAFDKVKEIRVAIEAAIIDNKEALEAFRIQYLGTKNTIKPLFGEIRTIPNERKKEYGQLVNEVKQAAEAKFNAAQNALTAQAANQVEAIDMTAPAQALELGSRHPVSLVLNQMIEIFDRLGFTVAEDSEIEDDWHNFTALNTPEDHPARDMQDTYYIMNDPSRLLRTHTSSVQSHVMMTQEPPIRIIAPGRVYRNETISSRAHCQFHQVEGLYIAEKVSFADLRQTIYYFAKEMFGATKIRMRPSFFPFTEPSAEVDVWWGCETETDKRITKGTGWLEILGCGMVDPAVLKNCGIDTDKYSGFAFGMGVERIAMLKYQIDDIRLLFENDVRFLRQFKKTAIF